MPILSNLHTLQTRTKKQQREKSLGKKKRWRRGEIKGLLLPYVRCCSWHCLASSTTKRTGLGPYGLTPHVSCARTHPCTYNFQFYLVWMTLTCTTYVYRSLQATNYLSINFAFRPKLSLVLTSSTMFHHNLR